MFSLPIEEMVDIFLFPSNDIKMLIPAKTNPAIVALKEMVSFEIRRNITR